MATGVSKRPPAGKSSSARGAEAPSSTRRSREPATEGRTPIGVWLVGAVAGFLRRSASWLISALVHMLVLMILALWLLPAPPEEQQRGVIAAIDEAMEVFEQLDELEELDPLEETGDVAFTIEAPGIAMLGDMEINAPGEEAKLSRVDFSAPSDELGSLFGSPNGSGQGRFGSGLGAEFYGVRAQGQRFVFVVDNSLSMNGGRFEAACIELMRSVGRMTPNQQFYVLFFSDTAYPMFHPEVVNHMLPATDENKQRLAQWLYGVELVLKTNAQEAVQRALKMHPDAIYLLTDGAFTDKTTPYLLKLPPGRTAIHTVGMEVKPEAANDLKAIAEHHHGTFRLVALDPRIRALAKQKARPTHRTRGAVWGIALPPAGQQKAGQGGKGKPGRQPGGKRRGAGVGQPAAR